MRDVGVRAFLGLQTAAHEAPFGLWVAPGTIVAGGVVFAAWLTAGQRVILDACTGLDIAAVARRFAASRAGSVPSSASIQAVARFDVAIQTLIARVVFFAWHEDINFFRRVRLVLDVLVRLSVDIRVRIAGRRIGSRRGHRRRIFAARCGSEQDDN